MKWFEKGGPLYKPEARYMSIAGAMPGILEEEVKTGKFNEVLRQVCKIYDGYVSHKLKLEFYYCQKWVKRFLTDVINEKLRKSSNRGDVSWNLLLILVIIIIIFNIIIYNYYY